MWATSSLQYLTRVRGYCSSIGYYVCPDTLLVASCRGSGGLVWHVGSTAPPVSRGDSWSVAGPSEDTPRSELCWGLDCGEKDCHEAFDLLGCVARKSFSSGVVNLWRLAAAEGR
ncbi:hypothetical protein BHM03_00003449 [Ensete ventricosum]|nr:hypothetical protein BHM03_00003449 [Ensete ventricosum]